MADSIKLSVDNLNAINVNAQQQNVYVYGTFSVVKGDLNVSGDLNVDGNLSVGGTSMIKSEMSDEYYIQILEDRGYKIEGLYMRFDALETVKNLIMLGKMDDALKTLGELFPKQMKHLDLKAHKYYRKKFTNPDVVRKIKVVDWNGQRIFIEDGEVIDLNNNKET